MNPTSMRAARVHPLRWLGERDQGLSALRRAGRTAIVMPAMFAVGEQVIGNPVIATFAAFGSFALLLLVDFTGPMRDRLAAQASLSAVGAVFICIATPVSRNAWLAAATMAGVGFLVLFGGVVSSVLAGASTSMLLAFILPVSLRGSVSSIPDRLIGWSLASAAAFVAVGLLWPAPARDPLRARATDACRALAGRLRAEVDFVLAGAQSEVGPRDEAIAAADAAVGSLHRNFLATPYRPTGLSTSTRAVVRLVDEVNWLNAILHQGRTPSAGAVSNNAACAVKRAAADVLDRGADLLDAPKLGPTALQTALGELTQCLDAMERNATLELPVRRTRAGPQEQARPQEQTGEFITSLDPSFRAQELSFAVTAIGHNIELAAAAERRGWLDRLIGRQPEGLSGRLSSAQERAAAHVERHSVWLHNSVRGGVALGLAVLLADLSGVQHSFWVVLGALSVLRSNALNTGQNALRGLLGTLVGFVLGAVLLALIGTNTTVLWLLLPIAVLLAGLTPAVVSFAAGQAAFTLTLVILFNLIQPAGWQIGLLRVEDIALGCAVSVVVGVLFWPRGAGAALSQALAEAYVDSARYLATAVEFGMIRCDSTARSGVEAPPVGPTAEAVRAAAASRRLDDTFRSFLAESGSKPIPLAEVTGLVTGAAALRLAGDAVLDLWQRDDGSAVGDRAVARRELLHTSAEVTRWYEDLGLSLTGSQAVREPLAHDKSADGRFLEAVRHDLRGDDGRASATAVRMIWTGDHLDAARRLQFSLTEAARAAHDLRTRANVTGFPLWFTRSSDRPARSYWFSGSARSRRSGRLSGSGPLSGRTEEATRTTSRSTR